MAELHSQAVPVQTLYTWFRDNKLIVNRRYQRKLVWTLEEKQKLLDSILSKYPIPAILLSEIEGPKENFEIIDGLQRMHAILSFIETSYPISDGRYFDLNYFPTAKDISEHGVFSDKSEGNVLDTGACSTLLNYQVSLSILRKASNTEVNEVFDRINTYGHRLSDQERRQAGVQSKFAELVRSLACSVRGDASSDRLFLYEMPSISIDLPKTRHGYEVRADEVFWVAQGVLRSTDLRDSEDEQCIADTVACIIGQDLIDRSKAALDAVYDASSAEYTRIETALDLYGSEKISEEFKFVLGEITKICAEGGATKLRDLLFEPKTTNAFPSVFTAIFLAIFECGVSQGKKISDYSGLKASLKGINKRIPVGQKGSNRAERRTNIDVVKGVISKFFVDDPDLAKLIFSNHKIVDIDGDIRRSEIELAHYELKQGLLPLEAGAKDPAAMLDKILRTICAIANNGPNSAGKILIGVADKEADIKRASEIDGVAGKVIGKRTVVGVCREAKRLGKSMEDYVQIVVNHIKSSNISEHTKGAALAHIDFNSYFDLGVLVISIPPQKDLTYLGDELYRRDGSNNTRVSTPKDVVALNSRFQ
ncbi:GmrSD restriction endonuclease domain-containing protein [Stappia indica]|uniref:GmrSD restriction endonuclease domain-containing protein n=1 Tax=Stappia indica TaxID=538381 RepID=UPI001CD3861C|nr:DUF262 domain-containing protein [Stappia indica]MCA1299808.1 DUF262 domain-containing protein [Stappia indica]